MKKFKSNYLYAIDIKSGVLEYDSFEIAPEIPFDDQKFFFTEDLIQIEFGEALCVDVGYYPATKPDGSFMIRIIRNEDWTKPIYKQRCKTLEEMKKYLQEAIDLADSLSHEKTRA